MVNMKTSEDDLKKSKLSEEVRVQEIKKSALVSPVILSVVEGRGKAQQRRAYVQDGGKGVISRRACPEKSGSTLTE